MNSDPSRVWRTIKSFSNKHRNYNSKHISKEILEKATTKFQNIVTEIIGQDSAPTDEQKKADDRVSASDEIHQPVNSDNPMGESEISDHLIKPFTRQEYYTAIVSLKAKSAPGPDLISNKIIKELPTSANQFLIRLFNLMFNYDKFPAQWQRFFMILIPKPNTTDFRPITLANNILKIFERILQYRLEWWVENSNIIPWFQYGFRRGKSCSDNISFICSYIREGYNNNSHTGAIFLNIKSAFDMVNHDKLFSILQKLGLPAKIIKFLSFVLKKRKVQGYAHGTDLGCRLANRGLPQGSILTTCKSNFV